MFAEERKQQVVDYVNSNASVTVDELCDAFEVSPATIRNDLAELEKHGLLSRTHGGAISNVKVAYEPVFESKEIEFKPEKEAIAQAAVRYIHDGDSILIDTGTTTFEMVREIAKANFKKITILTNDLQIATFFERNTDICVVMLGGILRNKYHYTLGTPLIESIKNFNVDIAFLGANGVSVEDGVTTTSLETAGVKIAFAAVAKKVVVLADSSKINKNKFMKFLNFRDMDVFITDSNVPDEFLSGAKEHDVIVKTVTV